MKYKKWWLWAILLLAVGGLALGIADYTGREEKVPGGTLVKNQTEEWRYE